MIEFQRMPELLSRLASHKGADYWMLHQDVRDTGWELLAAGGLSRMHDYLDEVWAVDPSGQVIGILDKAWEGVGGWTP